MHQFLSFVRKEYRHILRDARTMLILLAMPVVMILLYGFAITTEVRNASVGLLSVRPDVTVRHIASRLDASEYFTVERTMSSDEEVVSAFRNGDVQLVVAFNDDNTALQLIADGSEPNQASMVVNYAKGIIASAMQDLSAGVQTSSATIDITTRMLYNPQQKSAYNFVPGVMGLILMLICAMMTSIAIVREREQGTMEVLLASPLPPIIVILAKLVPYLTISIINISTILLLAVYVLDVPIVGSLWLMALLCTVFVLLALSLGMLISTFVNSQMAAMLLSGMVLMMPSMLLSGMMFAIESMPEVLQWLSAVVPVRWFIEALKKVMLQGCGVWEIAKELTILTSMTLFLLVVSLKNFKVRLE